jgi:hypothetical protein
MAEESLAEAWERLGIRPLPSVDELKGMREEERQAEFAASYVSAEQYEQLPAWYRDKLRRKAEETIARVVPRRVVYGGPGPGVAVTGVASKT